MSLRMFNSQNKTMSGLGANEVWLIIFNGESNSGGVALISDLSAPEVAARSSVQIWNNDTTGFEDLDIGTNNLLSHTGLTGASGWTNWHGWEAGLANSVEAGTLPNPVYLVKTGQGGSTISQWNVGGTYWNTMVSRIDAAISEIEGLGKTPRIVVWYTLGINDRIAGTDEATWKSGVQTFVSAFRTEYGSTIKFHSPLFMALTTGGSANPNANYNDTLSEIDSEDSLFFTVSSTGANLEDNNHWNAQGMKLIADRIISSMLTNP